MIGSLRSGGAQQARREPIMQPVSPRALRFHVAVLAAAGLASCAREPTARAQQCPSPSGDLEEVIVTPQTRQQNLQDISISLSACCRPVLLGHAEANH